MQYEGEHRQIALRGIERAAVNGVSQDGGMNEVIGMIPRNGSYVPYSPKEKDARVETPLVSLEGTLPASNGSDVELIHLYLGSDNRLEDHVGGYRFLLTSNRSVEFTIDGHWVKNLGPDEQGDGAGSSDNSFRLNPGEVYTLDESLLVFINSEASFLSEVTFRAQAYESADADTQVRIEIYAPDAGIEEGTGLSSAELLRVHHTSTGDNEIVVRTELAIVGGNRKVKTHVVRVNDVIWRIGVVIKDIVFIGNRMDLEIGDGIEHWLWKDGEYKNIDDIRVNENGESGLPYVSFKVDRGIYDGKTVYESARYVRLHKHYTDSDTNNFDDDAAINYVKGLGSMGSDAVALLDSIRHVGGITGYILVAAAWRVKASDASHPKYIMASPVLLMGAPEIYVKDGNYETTNTEVQRIQGGGTTVLWQGGSYVPKPTSNHLLDMITIKEKYGGLTLANSYEKCASDELWAMTESDDRSADDITAGEHVGIDLEAERAGCYIRYMDDGESSPSRGISLPGLWGNKFALWKSSKKEHRGIRVTHGSANVLSYQVSGSVPAEYKDEIDRLCLFVSPIISPYKHIDTNGIRMESNSVAGVDQNIEDQYRYSTWVKDGKAVESSAGRTYCGSFTPVLKSDEEICEEIKNIAGLYKAAEIQLNELEANTWLKVNLSEGRLETDRMVQHSDTMLKISDIQNVGFTKGHIFGYNERLHVYNFQKDEVYRLPYSSLLYHGGEGQYANNLYSKDLDYAVEVTDSNNSVIVSQFRGKQIMLNPLISCADIGAKQIRIVWREYTPADGVLSDDDMYTIGETIETPIEIGGVIGGYISKNLQPIKRTAMRVVTESEYNAAFRNESINPESYAYGKNEIRVSYPGSVVFEESKSYKVGHGEIIALARMTMGLSQDNYGKHPLVVFCTDGIYTLDVDASGVSVYSSQTPMSREICTNKNSICELDGAVLFATERGLQLITTDGVKPIALQAIGEPKSIADESNGLGLFHNAIRHANIVQLYDSISQDDFNAYIQDKDTHIRYLHAIGSVVVYNRQYDYSYMISVGDWVVTKIEQRIMIDNNDFPKQTFWLRYTNANEAKEVEFDYYSGAENTACLLQSRAIELETTHLKSAFRVVLRGVFEHKPTIDDGNGRTAVLCVFGSLDGKNWTYLGHKEKLLSNNCFHDIGVETYRTSVRYLMVVFAGMLSKDSHIEGLEITSMAKYNNKLK